MVSADANILAEVAEITLNFFDLVLYGSQGPAPVI